LCDVIVSRKAYAVYNYSSMRMLETVVSKVLVLFRGMNSLAMILKGVIRCFNVFWSL
jgi:hypothetical protein